MVTPVPSGTYNFQMDIFSVLKQAFANNGYQFSTLQPQDFDFARRALNLLFADWTAQGYILFDLVNNTFTCVQGQIEYELPTNVYDILIATLRDNSSGVPIDAPVLQRVSLETYVNFPDPTTQALPVMYFLWRGNTPTVAPIMYIYPTSANSTYQISYWALTQIQDVSTSSGLETAGIPYRWTKAMVDGLSVEIAKYKRNVDMYPILVAEYQKSFAVAAAGDADIAGLDIAFDYNSKRKFRR